MKAKVYLEPEYSTTYTAKCQGKPIDIAPAFDPDLWYARFQMADGEIKTFVRAHNMVTICDGMRNEGYDLRYAVWCPEQSKRHGYNPYLSFDKHEAWAQVNPNVYFVKNPVSGLIKIGFSDCYLGRIRSLESEFKAKLELLGLLDGGRHEEKEIHGLLSACRVEKEWFTDLPSVRDFIKEYCYLPVLQ